MCKDEMDLLRGVVNGAGPHVDDEVGRTCCDELSEVRGRTGSILKGLAPLRAAG
jgi:hypothetical protein